MSKRTNDIVAILITNQQRDRTLPLLNWCRYSGDDLLPLLFTTELDALFDHVTSELMSREIHQLRGHKRDNLCPVTFSAMFNDMLSDIVAELIHDQRCCASVQLLENGRSGRFFAVFKHPLDDTTAIRMCRKSLHLSCESVDDELDVLSWDPLDGLLYNMISILILDASQNVFFQLLD